MSPPKRKLVAARLRKRGEKIPANQNSIEGQTLVYNNSKTNPRFSMY